MLPLFACACLQRVKDIPGSWKGHFLTHQDIISCAANLSSLFLILFDINQLAVRKDGRSVDKEIYVKNNGDQGVYLSLFTQNWTPSAAADDIQLS